jgi:hypothetical protein
MSATPIPTLTPSPRRWSCFPVCCLTVVLGVIGTWMIRAHMDGLIDPDDLDGPILLIIVALLLSIPVTACAWWSCPRGVWRRWLKQALLLQAVGLLWSGLIVGAGPLSESLAFDRTLQNAHRVAAAVEEFHLRRGRYPHSLREVEEDAGRDLPRPVYAGEFGYGQDNGTFYLSFSRRARGYWQGWILDGRSGVLTTLC